MNLIEHIIPYYQFLKDAFLLLISTCAILIVLSYFGFAFASICFLDKLKEHTTYLLPSIGVAVIGLGCGVPSFIGVPVDYSAPYLAIFVTIINALLLVRKGKYIYNWNQNVLHSEFKHSILKIAVITFLVVSCASVFEYSYPGNSYHSVWGSTDFSGYWDAADYLKQYGGTHRDYASQSTYGPGDSSYLWILGSMKYASNAALAFITVPPFIRTELVIVPFIVTMIVAAMLILIVFSEESGEKSLLPVILATLVPFTYFCLYFSYLAQAVGTCITILVALLLGYCRDSNREPRSYRCIIGTAFMALGAMMSHESQIPIILALVVVYIVFNWVKDVIEMRRSGGMMFFSLLVKNRTPLFFLLFVIVVLVLPFADRMIASLEYYANLRPMVGWEWPRLPSVEDFLGARVPYATTANTTSIWVTLILTVGFLGPMAVGLLRQKHVVALLSLLIAQSLIVLSGFWYVVHNVQNASHAVWKAVSLFDWLIIFLFASGCIIWVRKLSDRKFVRYSSILIMATLYVVPIVSIARMNKLPQMYNTLLVDLLRRHSAWDQRAYVLSYPGGWITSHIYDPVVKSTKNLPVTLADWKTKGFTCDKGVNWFVWQGRDTIDADIRDSEGTYHFGLPPSFIDLSKESGAPWLLDGFYGWEGHKYRWVGKRATLILGHAKKYFYIQISTQMNFIRAISGNDISRMPIEIWMNGVKAGSIRASSGTHSYTLSVPSDVASLCPHYVVVSIRAEYGYHAGLNINDPRMISWGLTKLGFVSKIAAENHKINITSLGESRCDRCDIKGKALRRPI